MSISSLETLLRYSYLHGYNCTQWAGPARQCLQHSEQDLTQDLCDLLLKHLFSTARVHSIRLDSYLTYALLGDSPTATTTQKRSNDNTKAMVKGKQLLSRLVNRDARFALHREYSHQWTTILRLLPSLLMEMDSDRTENISWAPIISKLLVILSHIVSVGVYPQRKSRRQRVEHNDNYMYHSDSDSDDRMNQQTQGDDFTASQQFNFSYTNNNTQMAADSQMTVDPDATFDLDATQPDPSNERDDDPKSVNEADNSFISGGNRTTTATTHSVAAGGDPLAGPTSLLQRQDSSLVDPLQHPSQSSSLYPSTWNGSTITSPLHMDSSCLEWENALSAAKIIIDLIEKKGAKRIIEKYEEEQKKNPADLPLLEVEDPWVTCHEILLPDDKKASSPTKSATPSSVPNAYIQKLLLLMERLTDRDLEQRLAVHMKYHELEDEGAARAMPSAGLMGLVYYMVQIRPGLDDDALVDRLVKLQAVKGLFDESLYLELWFAALTGLREASMSTNCQTTVSSDKKPHDHRCNTTVATNRLLWKNLVLVKLPYLIRRFQERKEKEQVGRRDLHRNAQSNKSDAIESSLLELKKFTDLLNTCSPVACCPEFHVPSAKPSKLMDRFTAVATDDDHPPPFMDDDDSMMHMIDDTRYSTDINAPSIIQSLRSISTEDIFTSLVRCCQFNSLLTDNNALLNSISPDSTTFKSERYDYDDGFPTHGSNKLKKQYSSFSLLEDDMMDDLERESDGGEKPDVVAQVDENIQQRMKEIRSTMTKASVSELIHIGIVSLIHWRRIVDFLLEVLNDSVQEGNLDDLVCVSDALNDCPSAIDLILQLYPPTTLLAPLETVCNTWNPTENYMDVDGGNSSVDGNDGDDMDGLQSWFFKFGKIWTLVLLVTSKSKASGMNGSLATWSTFKDKQGMCYRYFMIGPVIYGAGTCESEVEAVVHQWLSAMGGDGISDELLRTTKVQMLLQAVPSLIDRLLIIHEAGRMAALTDVLSYFCKRFLHLLLIPGVTSTLCEALLNREDGSTVLMCMAHLFLHPSFHGNAIQLCGPQVLDSLYAYMERQRQYRNLDPSTHQQQQQQETNEQRIKDLERFFITKLDLDRQQIGSPETSTVVTRRTLMEQTQAMFHHIVKSGRCMHMADGDTKALWDPVADPPKQVVSHFLDLALFQAALQTGGQHWFISMIVDEVLEAGKSGGAVRAAELGSCLLTTPLVPHTCLPILRRLLQDVIPATLERCATVESSLFQGQTLGVFVSDCLVSMHEDDVLLGRQFFEALAIDRVDDISLWATKMDQDNSKFARWDDDDKVVGSPVWRGFVKGLMSNPFIKQMWPDAYTS